MKQRRSVATTQDPHAGSVANTITSDRRQRWLFRLLAALVVPGLLLSLIEGGLRIAGYGHPTSFFVKSPSVANQVLVENTWFGLRFFPPALARSPAPLTLLMPKPRGVYRVFLFGESAALGDPRPSYGAGRYLETLLNERFPGRKVEVVCVAMTAINSHAILPIARECKALEGDLWILYAGHNEMAGPFGATPVFGRQAPPWQVVRAQLAVQHLRLGQLLAHGIRLAQAGGADTGVWGGLKMFTDHSVSLDLPAREQVYRNFHRNLRDIVRTAQQAGIPILLSSAASNLRDCAPFGSSRGPSDAQTRDPQAEMLGRQGDLLAQKERWNEAAVEFKAALQKAPHSSHLHFQLARSLLALGDPQAALASFKKARDLDTLPFRADSSINALIADEGRQSTRTGIRYVDAEAALAREAESTIPGNESFYEHVHLNPDGNYRLARAWAEAIAPFLESQSGESPTAWLDPEGCSRRLALTDWNRIAALEEMLRRVHDAPFTNQLNHAAHLEHLQSQRTRVRERMQHTSASALRSVYETCIRLDPADPWLRRNYAEYLTAQGNLGEAAEQMKQVRDLVPHHYAAHLQLGSLLARLKRYDEARQALREALQRRPELSDACLELGMIAAQQGLFEEALSHFNAAIVRRPDGVGAYLRKADVLAVMRQRPAAIQSLRDAIRFQPSSWEARYLLGIELAKEGEILEATTELNEVVQLQPEHVLSRLNLGNLLVRQQRLEDALIHFREAVRLDPSNQLAQDSVAALSSPSFNARTE